MSSSRIFAPDLSVASVRVSLSVSTAQRALIDEPARTCSEYAISTILRLGGGHVLLLNRDDPAALVGHDNVVLTDEQHHVTTVHAVATDRQHLRKTWLAEIHTQPRIGVGFERSGA